MVTADSTITTDQRNQLITLLTHRGDHDLARAVLICGQRNGDHCDYCADLHTMLTDTDDGGPP